MDAVEVKETLFRISRIQMPPLEKDAGLTRQIDVVSDYLVQTAIARAELERARLYISAALEKLDDQWDEIEGWQAHLPSSRPTNVQVDMAKRVLSPEVYGARKDARWLMKRLADQVHRMEGDDAAASRLYTMLTGG